MAGWVPREEFEWFWVADKRDSKAGGLKFSKGDFVHWEVLVPYSSGESALDSNHSHC
jgi:hypothetical protein